MQTERVTFLTSPDHKAALDAYATTNGRSVGHVLREASSTYIAGPVVRRDDELTPEQEAEFTALVEQVNIAIPQMAATLDRMSETLRATRGEIDKALRDAGLRT